MNKNNRRLYYIDAIESQFTTYLTFSPTIDPSFTNSLHRKFTQLSNVQDLIFTKWTPANLRHLSQLYKFSDKLSYFRSVLSGVDCDVCLSVCVTKCR